MKDDQIKYPSMFSSFEEIREEDLLYVDKTEYIHKLLTTKGFTNWFLARPRRFGKTLFLDTFEQFFLGREELFRGLYIHSTGYDFKPCPVLRLNMARSASSTDELKSSIIFHLDKIAEDNELALKSQAPGEALEGLIIDLRKKTKQPVVVLIDEYDKPILDHIDNPKLANRMINTLRNFYFGLKNVEEKLSFVFVTGISKYGKTAIHSALNNLQDITHSPSYAAICGFTEREFINNFHLLFDNFLISATNSGHFKKEYDHKVLIKSILNKYNGYSWDGKTQVLNPYSINNCFSNSKLENYWWQTGPPLLLEHAMSENPTAYLPPDWGYLPEDDFDKTEIGDLRPFTLLFQTGYLTIDTATTKTEDIVKSDGTKSTISKTYYSLRIPNDEVFYHYTSALFINLFPFLSYEPANISCRDNIANSIKAKDPVKLTIILREHLASVPYTQDPDRTKKWKHDPKLGEFFFQAVFLSFFVGLGLSVIRYPLSSRGRSDIAIILDENIFVVFKLKYIAAQSDESQTADKLPKEMKQKADDAIKQLENTLQDKKYLKNASKIILAGIVIYDHDIILVKISDNASFTIS